MLPVPACALVFGLFVASCARSEESRQIKVLFLGDNGHHRPAERFRQLQPILAKRGIDLTYTDKVDVLNAQTLGSYDGLLIYANTTKITPDQEKALLGFVEGGKGFIPLHCASYCFLNSPKYVALVGAQFLRHGTGTFRTVVAEPSHPVMKGFDAFESWDETYVHAKHNEKDRAVLEYREEKGAKEPWTWLRTQGKGRVFYTAWGHDQRTWGHPGFHNLVERGIRWAVGRDPAGAGLPAAAATATAFERIFAVPEMAPKRTDVKPFEYVDVGKKIPNYTPNAAWGRQGEPFSKMQKPLPAEESHKHLVVPAGFRAELFVSEEQLGGGKPLCMTWDERGRLWVALTYDYPNNLQPPGQGHDRIVICEDTTGAGRADKVSVFAEKLSIPTSMMFARGGLIVFDAGQTVSLKDTDGDGKADVRDVLFGVWSMRDTHGTASNMQYGLDNWIWAMQGYNPSRLTVAGETHQFRQGFFRFKPPHPQPLSREGRGEHIVSKLEFLRSTDNNTWGLGISEEGIVFGSTANRNPSVYMPIPNRYYEAVKGWTPSLVLRMIADTYRFKPITDKVRQVDQFGGYTAAAGHSLYTARRYPKEYWNRTAFVSDPTGHLTGAFVLRSEGSNFRSTNSFNLLASDDEWTGPIMAEVGPDGNVWVIDWYNYIVQHNPTPIGFRTGRGAAYETDLRDQKYARIYRVVYDGKDKGRESLTLADATPEKLVATLKNDNLFWRRHAQRLLVERGQQDVVPALCALVRDESIDEIGLNVGAIHALWTLHGLGALDSADSTTTAVLSKALEHRSAGVRRNAVQVLPKDERSVGAILYHNVLRDPDPHVRLMALLALADQPPKNPDATDWIVAALTDASNLEDRWIPDAAICAAANRSEFFLQALGGVRQPPAKFLTSVSIVAEHYARGNPADSLGRVLTSMASADARIADAVVRGLAKGWPAGNPPRLDERLEQTLEQLVKQLVPEGRGVLIRLARTWGSKRFENFAAEATRSLLARIQNETLKTDERLAAARELVGYQSGDAGVAKALLEFITPATPPELASGFLEALRVSEASEVGRLIVDRLSSFTPSARASAIRVLLSRPSWTSAFLDSAEKGLVSLTELSLDQKQALTEHLDRGVRRRAQELFRKGGVLPNPDRQKVLSELLPIAKEKGDPVAGKAVFKTNCAKCHVHGDEGTRIGPDLTGTAVHPKEHLLGELIDPSRSVEANFRSYTLATKAGRTLTGLLAAESRTAVELFDAEGKKQTILRADIDELVASNRSLMPDGFEKQVSRKDLRDLLEFLAQRGKYLPLPLNKVATAVSTRGMFYSEEAPEQRLVFDDWAPKTFRGIPFHLVDPQGDRSPNVILLYCPEGKIPPKMPRTVALPCNAPAKAIHLLSGVSGWGYPYSEKGTVSMIVRLHYDDGKTEDHVLKNGLHFADYIRRIDVPDSEFAFRLRGKQIRYLAVLPARSDKIRQVEFVKGPDGTAPVIMAVTVEAPQ